MAETKDKKLSVRKRARQNTKRNLGNRAVMSTIKTLVKKVITSLDTKDTEMINANLREAAKKISSAVSKGVFHKNTGSRKISKLTKLVNRSLKAEAV